MYDLAGQTFSQILNESPSFDLKNYLVPMAETFVKTGDVGSLKKLIKIWEAKYPSYHRGVLLAAKLFVDIKSGKPFKESFDKNSFLALSVNGKVEFLRVISDFPLSVDDKFYLLTLGEKNVDIKGALAESGFLEKFAEEAVKYKRQDITDYLFANYGDWLNKEKFALPYVRYLISKGKYADAVLRLQKLYAKDKSPEILFELAKVYYLQGEYGKALKLARKLNSKEAKFLRAWAYFKLGLKKKAFEELGMSVKKPAVPESLKVAIDFFKGKIDPDAVKKYYPEYYYKALLYTFSTFADESVNGVNYHDAGFFFYESGKFDKAFDYLKQAVAVKRDRYLTPRTLYIIGETAGINKDIGVMVYSRISNSYQRTPYYKASIIPYARALILKGDFSPAVKVLEYGKEQFKMDTPLLRKLLGKAYYFAREYGKSEKVLKPIIFKDDEAFHFFILDKALNGKLDVAFEYLRLKLNNNRLFAYVDYGRLFYLSSKLGKTKLIKKVSPPKEPTVATMYGVIAGNKKLMKSLLSRVSEVEKMVLLYTLATIEKSPEKRFYYLSLLKAVASTPEIAKFAQQMEEYDAYVSGKFDTLLLNNPEFIAYNPENTLSDIHALIEKANDYYDAKGFLKAYGLYRMAVERSSDPEIRTFAAMRMVDIDLKLKNYRRAVEDASMIPEDTEKRKDVKNFLLMEIYYKQGRLLDALNAGRAVSDIENLPEDKRIKFAAQLASLYKLAGKETDAMRLLNYIVNKGHLSEIDYDDLVNLALFLDKKGKRDDAEKLLKEAYRKAKKKEQKAESLFWLATVQEEKGDVDSAVMNYLKIHYEIGSEPWNSTAIYKAASILESQGKYEQALKLYRKVFKIKGKSPEGLKALERIKEIEKKMRGGLSDAETER
ncbi:tetratricopeptide repeat protein [Desulfurobacterium atlanticum]|uniref:Tetratricopeptide repeat-containing protein n=1 Tax=Desulfurobacterium atlanticum TaxID=240169 RepID=A0A238ZTE0_9BACT|nr:CDC27 family protein [Desulfurobacterium atlanticum]SNR85933.1 Tetratricopeptide repeat-containing protein [Desulfurobacterium atlanticum]